MHLATSVGVMILLSYGSSLCMESYFTLEIENKTGGTYSIWDEDGHEHMVIDSQSEEPTSKSELNQLDLPLRVDGHGNFVRDRNWYIVPVNQFGKQIIISLEFGKFLTNRGAGHVSMMLSLYTVDINLENVVRFDELIKKVLGQKKFEKEIPESRKAQLQNWKIILEEPLYFSTVT